MVRNLTIGISVARRKIQNYNQLYARHYSSEANVKPSDWHLLKMITTKLWPRPDQHSLKRRVYGAISILFLGKLLNIQVPYLFKRLVEATESEINGHEHFITWLQGLDSLNFSVIGVLCASYVGVRAGSSAMNELRNIIFSKVTETCTRQLTLETLSEFLRNKGEEDFYRIHRVPMLSRALDRATRGIRFLVTSVLLNLAPTLFEVCING
jgi:ATP-binding cassette, subfamily B (MDR/TAP), member 7